MTDPTADSARPAPGWYPDPAGSAQLRWWDGERWTEHLHAATDAAASAGASAAASGAAPGYAQAGYAQAGYAQAAQAPASPPRLPDGAPIYNGVIWVIVLLPVLSIVGFGLFDLRGYVEQAIVVGGQPAPQGLGGSTVVFDPGYLLIGALGWAIYGVTVVLAVFDRRALARVGVVAPFHWAWAFLSGIVYVIGRSVVVRRRSGRGLAPIWVLVGVYVAYLIVIVVKVSDAVAAMIAMLPAY